MTNAHSMQCTRGRSLVLWRGHQWSVTNRGVETTDPNVPHVIIPPEQMDRVDRVIDGQYSPLLPRSAKWFDADELVVMVDRARMIHHR